MMGFQDTAKDIKQAKNVRMNFRTKPRVKETIQRAAALIGVGESALAMNAAYKEALEIINAHQRTQLQPEDHEAFFNALDNPPAANKKLRAAFDLHQKIVTSK